MEQDLKPQDMPSPSHPLLENDAEVRSLGELIDVRENQSQGTPELDAEDDEDLDVSAALTFPHTKRQRDTTPDDITDFDGDARTSSPADDADDMSYMGRADVEQSMLETDPDPNTGSDEDDLVGDAGLGRAPDLTGTVTGIAPGMGTHLPQDLGAGGFQIEEPDANLDARVDGSDEPPLEDDLASDGGRIPTAKPNINTRDEALDATRQLQ